MSEAVSSGSLAATSDVHPSPSLSASGSAFNPVEAAFRPQRHSMLPPSPQVSSASLAMMSTPLAASARRSTAVGTTATVNSPAMLRAASLQMDGYPSPNLGSTPFSSSGHSGTEGVALGAAELSELLHVRVSYDHNKLTGLLQQILARLANNEEQTRGLAGRIGAGYTEIHKEVRSAADDNNSLKTRFASMQQDVALLRTRMDSNLSSTMNMINKVQADGQKERLARSSVSTSSSSEAPAPASMITPASGIDLAVVENRQEETDTRVRELEIQLEKMAAQQAAGEAECGQLRDRAERAEARIYEIERQLGTTQAIAMEVRDGQSRATAEREGQQVSFDSMRNVVNSMRAQVDHLGAAVGRLNASSRAGSGDGDVSSSVAGLRAEMESVREKDRERDAQLRGSMDAELRAGLERVSRLEAQHTANEERHVLVAEAIAESKRELQQVMLRSVR